MTYRVTLHWRNISILKKVTSELEKLFSNAHSYDEYLWQVAFTIVTRHAKSASTDNGRWVSDGRRETGKHSASVTCCARFNDDSPNGSRPNGSRYSTLDYLTRLKSLEQCSLEKRHIVHDLVLTYKIVLGLLMFGRQISLHCAWNDAAPTRDNSCKVLLNVSRIKVIRHFLLNELLVSGIVCHLPSLILEVCRLSRELSITLMWFYLHDIDVLYGFITCIVSLFIFTACAFL